MPDNHVESPLPFGVQCVPDSDRPVLCLDPKPGVSIAFRRSVRSRPCVGRGYTPRTARGLHCLSAFSAFPTRLGPENSMSNERSPLPFGVQCVPDAWLCGWVGPGPGGLHCLSAFSAFPTNRMAWKCGRVEYPVSIAFRRSVRSRHRSRTKLERQATVSIAFRRSVRSRRRPNSGNDQQLRHVSIAFRRSVRSRPRRMLHWLRIGFSVSIAFRRSVRSRQNADYTKRGLYEPCLHCLSAFSAFPTAATQAPSTGCLCRLHCLSAFSAFPTRVFPRAVVWWVSCLHCLSAFSAFPTRRSAKQS